MVNKKNLRVRKAEQRRREQAKIPLHIISYHELRTLKRSARKQLDRERAPTLWIIPWHEAQRFSAGSDQRHSQASLLGLPTELRQNILYESYSIQNLEEDAQTSRNARPTRMKRLSARVGTEHVNVQGCIEKAIRAKFGPKSYEDELVAILGRRIGALSRISPLIYMDMQYVRKRWQNDLEKYLDQRSEVQLHAPTTSIMLQGHRWHFAPNIASLTRRNKKGEVIRAGRMASGKRVRPPKCWYCTERHLDGDLMCPMARRDPETWQNITRKVGGWRAKTNSRPTIKAKKVVFED
jgi:hypothetical protein